MNARKDRALKLDHSHDCHNVPCEPDSNPGLRVDDIPMTTEGSISFAGIKNRVHIKVLMPGNQSFDQSLYVPLTRAPLPCRSEVHFLKDGVHEA
jgi:hypothetical protein